jgi:hypothetical protein
VQAALPIDLPRLLPGTPLGKLTLVQSQDRTAAFFRDLPLFHFRSGDRAGLALTIAQIADSDLASHIEIANALGLHRNTVGRVQQRYVAGGLGALVPAKRGPKGPHKLTPEILALLQERRDLSSTKLSRLIAEQTDTQLSAAYIRQLRGQLPELQAKLELATAEQDTIQPEIARSASAAPQTVQEESPEPEPASVLAEPLAPEPEPLLSQQVRGRYMGAALYFTALQVLDLVKIAGGCFRIAASERFGLRATTLSLFFLALLDLPTVEAAKYLRRREFGALIGTQRAPAVKTLRRKLAELVPQGRSVEFGQRLARRLVEQSLVATAALYVDGHMKVYTGKRKLGKTWNTQRRLPLPGFNSFFVGDAGGRPLLFLTEEAGVSLTQAMPEIVEAIRGALGNRRFTVVFDRGGFDGKLFQWLDGEGVDFITYQVGTAKLEDHAFRRHRARLEGQRCYFELAEDVVKVNRLGPWRRIVVRRPDGYQLPILTSSRAPAASIVALADKRWRQENFFKYMRQHKGLDQIASYQFEEVSGDRQLPNPARGQLQGQIRSLARELEQQRAALGKAVLQQPDPQQLAQASAAISALQDQLAELRRSLRNAPSHVPADQAPRRDRLKLEQKTILDRFKLTAYQAEQWMLERLLVHYPNHHDAHALLRDFAQLSGDMRFQGGRIQITLDPPDTPSHRQALAALCAELSQYHAVFPGTDIPVEYHVAVHHSQALP